MLEKVKIFFQGVWQWVVRYPMAVIGLTVFFVGLTLLFIILPGRAKRVNIGGVLGWFLGEKTDTAHLPAEVQRPVPPGVADEKGFVEQESEGYIKKETGPFRDKSKVVVVDRNGMEHPVQLPSGVQDDDVRRIVEVSGDKVVVEVVERPAASVTADMLKYFIFLLVTFVSSWSYAQSCPEGYKCIPDSEAVKVRAVLEEYACMEKAAASGNIGVTLEPYQIVITHAGQVLAKEYIAGTISWCAWDLRWKMQPKFQITREEPPQIPTYGARVRLRAGVMFVPLWESSFKEAFDPVLFLESVYWRSLHLSTHLGFRTLGTGLGVDLTNTVDVFAGVGVRWGTWQVLPVVGLSVALH